MSLIKSKGYPSEFKESAVKLASESGRPAAQVAKELGINVPYIAGSKNIRGQRILL
jgi:transposase